MNLPHLFAASDKTTPQFFLAIHISELAVQSALWSVVEGQVELKVQSTQHSWRDDESCVAAVDQSLQELGKESEQVNQVLFALNSEWVNGEGIIPAKKPLFQRLTKELQLEAIGFVVTTEALVQHLTQNVSPQLSLFLIEVSVQHLTVSLIRQGQIAQSEKVGRSGDPVSDLTEAFAHFEEKVFPTKLMLFSVVLSDQELQDVRQQLFNHDWPSSYPFLHPPMIEIFSSTNLMELIVKTGGQAVAEAKGLMTSPAVTPSPEAEHTTPEMQTEESDTESEVQPKDSLSASPTAVAASSVIEAAPEVVATTVTASPVVSADESELAEIVDEADEPLHSILTPEDTPVTEVEPQLTAEPETAEPVATSFGVPIPPQAVEHQFSADEEWHDAEIESATSLSGPSRQLPDLSFLTQLSPTMAAIIGVVVGLIVLLIIAMVAAHSLEKAVITVNLDSKNISQDATLTLDPKAPATDPTRLILKAEPVTKQVTGQKSAPTTGSKLIGNKATGTVTLYNYTTNQKVFTSGTKLTAGKLSFTLDQSVTLASASSSVDSSGTKLTKPGTGNVAATATQIGPDSNITSGTQFAIESFATDTYLAKAQTAFTGGDSHQAQVVSQADRDKLLASLRQDLDAQAVQQLASSGTTKYLATGKDKVIKAEYTPDVGKEAASVQLTLTIEAQAVSYQASDLKPLALQVLSSRVPAGYQLSPSDPSILSAPDESATGSAQMVIHANFSSVATPLVNLQSWQNAVAGKTPVEAQSILSHQVGVRSAQVDVTPKLLGIFFKTLPKKPDSIEISLE